MKSKTKSSFYFVSLISVADKKVTRVGVYTRHIWVHIPAYITCVYGICEVRLGRGGACLRLFIATLFRAYKYYFRPSWSGHAIARQLSGFMIWPSHTEIYTYTHICRPSLCMPLLSIILVLYKDLPEISEQLQN